MLDRLPAELAVEPRKWMEGQQVAVEPLPDSGYPL